MNSTEYSGFITTNLPTENMVYAVQVHGTFPTMKVRAIPAQQKPYPTLTEAAKNQSVHEYRNVTGTIVGFYTPVFFKGSMSPVTTSISLQMTGAPGAISLISPSPRDRNRYWIPLPVLPWNFRPADRSPESISRRT